MNRLGILSCCLSAALALGGCRPNPQKPIPNGQNTDDFIQIPEGWANPEFPEDNGFTDVRWALGKDLFFDVRLSVDGSVSCAQRSFRRLHVGVVDGWMPVVTRLEAFWGS